MLFQNKLDHRDTAAQSELNSLALESRIPPAGVAAACAAELRNPCVLPASGCRAVAAARESYRKQCRAHTLPLCFRNLTKAANTCPLSANKAQSVRHTRFIGALSQHCVLGFTLAQIPFTLIGMLLLKPGTMFKIFTP